jgi:hypothetical protein
MLLIFSLLSSTPADPLLKRNKLVNIFTSDKRHSCFLYFACCEKLAIWRLAWNAAR